MSDIKIDFVVPWVDGSDPEWQKEFKKYSPDPASCDARFERYRDWDLMKYWFRGVEKNSPWVNKIYFITWGHVPEWLDVNHPKLVIVKHEDYIPTEYLPTFSSHPIELNMHRIEGLSEHFVYFNDDFFLIDEVEPEDFFVDGLPCDMAVQAIIGGTNSSMSHIKVNNITTINENFNNKEVILNNISKWFNIEYGINNLRNLIMLPWGSFSNFYISHLPQAYTLSILNEVWDKNEWILKYTSSQKFRSFGDVNQYLFKQWNLCKGTFYPQNQYKLGSYFDLGVDTDEACKSIMNKNRKILVLNDGDVDDFIKSKEKVSNAFDTILKERSRFEI